MIYMLKFVAKSVFIILLLFSEFAIANTAYFDPESDKPFDFNNPASPWYEQRQAIFSRLLSINKGLDILVLPFQVRDNGIDLVGRSLMSRYIEDGLTKQYKMKIPTLDLVEIALGEHKRRFEIEKVFDLANKLRVKKIVVGYSGHNNNGEMTVTIRVYSRSKSKNKLFDKNLFDQKEWANLPIDDQHLPSYVFYSKLDQIISFISGKKSNIASQKRPVEKLQKKLPAKFEDIVLSKKNNSALMNAYYLQLIGILHPKENFRRRERAFEKSLIALSKTSHKSEYFYILKARALHYLHRRPAALKELAKTKDSAEKTSLHAQLNGNLPLKLKNTKNVKNPLMKLFDVIEAETLFYKYNSKHNKEVIDKLDYSSPDWKYLVTRRIDDLDPWAVESNIRVKAILDEVFPISISDVKSDIRAQLLQGKNSSIDMDLSVVEHFSFLLSDNPLHWCCKFNSWQVSKWDYLNLLDGIAESNLLKKISRIVDFQGNLDKGYELFEKLERIYHGHPQFANVGIRVLSKKFKEAKPLERNILGEKGNNLAIGMFAWTNGQRNYLHKKTDFFFDLLRKELHAEESPSTPQDAPKNYEYAKRAFFNTDFPARSYWRPLSIYSPKNKLEYYARAVNYSASNFEPILNYKNDLPTEDLEVLSKLLEHRFIGHPKRLELLADIKRIKGEEQSELNIYKEAIKNNSNSWAPYWKLGKRYVEQGKFKKASKIFESFPIFTDSQSVSKVAISNRAYSAALLFYDCGKFELARRFFEIASNTNTGSRSDYGSKAKLSLLEKDYVSAAEYFYIRARRYNVDYDFGMLMTLLHAMGEHKDAWDIFDSLVGKVDGFYLWLGPFVGHRMQETSVMDLAEWSDNPRYKDSLSPGKTPFSTQMPNMDRKAFTLYLKSVIKVGRKTGKVRKHSHIYTAVKSQDKNLIQDIESLNFVDFTQINSSDAIWYPYHVLAQLYYLEGTEKSNIEKTKDLNVWASLNLKEIEKESGEVDNNGRFNLYLATSILQSKKNNHKEALSYLRKAFRFKPEFGGRELDPVYQLVEISEWLFKLTKKREYIEQALEWAKIYQIIYPVFSWPYTFEAKYSNNEESKLRALAIGQYLDPASSWISEIPEHQKQRAKKWFKNNNPFDIQRTKNQQDV